MKAIWRLRILTVSLVCLSACGSAPFPGGEEGIELEGVAGRVHDPSIVKAGPTYYVFSTGTNQSGHIPIRCSTDLNHWSRCGHVFDVIPAWIRQEIPEITGLWAPDISYFSGKYHLYYAASTFGKNRSIIGQATNRTLDPSSEEYEWVDEGKVIESFPEDDWNAIDPNIIIDEKEQVWMAFGSFWSGIKMHRMDPSTGKLSTQDQTMYWLASRPIDSPHYGAIEAPFVFYHGGYYYLFVSFDFCCRGADSTYKIMVGRSAVVTGSYLDKTGTPMLDGGGTLLLESGERWRGPGGQSVLHDQPADLLVYHAYAATTGEPFLQVANLHWTDEWPVVVPLEPPRSEQQ